MSMTLAQMSETITSEDFRRIYEPVGMSNEELVEWYLASPAPFRRANMRRIADLNFELLARAILDAAKELAAPSSITASGVPS